MMVRVTAQILQSSRIQIFQNPEQVVVMSRSGTLNRTLSLKYDVSYKEVFKQLALYMFLGTCVQTSTQYWSSTVKPLILPNDKLLGTWPHDWIQGWVNHKSKDIQGAKQPKGLHVSEHKHSKFIYNYCIFVGILTIQHGKLKEALED